MASNLLFPFLLLISLTFPYWSAAIAGGDEAADLPCVKELLPCQQYLHESKPPAKCCLPLLSAIQKEAVCLCAVFYSEPILTALNLTQEEALHLPRSCGGNVPDVGKCKNIGGGGGDGPTPSPPTPSPPATAKSSPAAPPKPSPATPAPPTPAKPSPATLTPPAPTKHSPSSNGSSPSTASIGNSIASACLPILAVGIASVTILALI